MPDISLAKYLIGISRIKYDVLNELFENNSVNSDIVNLYIDAHTIFQRMYRNNILSDLYSVDSDVLTKDIVIAFINTLGHYRRYMATRLKKTNRIFVVFNRKIPTYQSSIDDSYGEEFFGKYRSLNKDYGQLTEAINKAYDFIQGLVPYLEGIYCINNDKIEDFTVLHYLINHPDTKGDFNIVLTRNILGCQLLSKRCVMIYPKREKSRLYTADTCFKLLVEDRKTESEILPVSAMAYYTALLGTKESGLSTIGPRGTTAAVTLLNKMYTAGDLTEKTSINAFCESVNKYLKKALSDIELNELQRRYKMYNLSLSSVAMTNSQRGKVDACLYDLYDQDGLDELNETLIRVTPDEEILELSNLNLSYVSPDESYQEWYNAFNL